MRLGSNLHGRNIEFETESVGFEGTRQVVEPGDFNHMRPRQAYLNNNLLEPA
jgi:hypothetical protein